MEDWNKERDASWEAADRALDSEVTLASLTTGWKALVLPDTRDLALETLTEGGVHEWKAERLNPEWMQALVGGVQVQEKLHRNVLEHVHVNRERTATSMNKGSLPTFLVGNCVMVARVHERGELKRLVSNRMGPWRMVLAGG